MTQDEAVKLEAVLRAIAEGYPAHGEEDRYVVVENSDFAHDNGSDPCLVFDTRTLPPVQDGFQARVDSWLLACFGEEIARDRTERNHRFLEEALELVQACGCTASEAHQLVDYTFGRPVGEMGQEVGGVMNTLAALCLAHGIDMAAEGDREITRCWEKIDRIREKQRNKPKHSPLPESAPVQDDDVERVEQVISAWAFAHDIDGAARNDLFKRLRESATRPTTHTAHQQAVEAELRAALDRAAAMSGLVAGDFMSPPQPPAAGEGKS